MEDRLCVDNVGENDIVNIRVAWQSYDECSSGGHWVGSKKKDVLTVAQ